MKTQRPTVLDLFCGAGGAAMGYLRAGFRVIGVDKVYQPNYCGSTFVQADALAYLKRPDALKGISFIHASPPCQAYSLLGKLHPNRKHPDLIGAVRNALLDAGLPFVIENVPGSPLRQPVILCGSMFGLLVRRHRLFEHSGFDLPQPECRHDLQPDGVVGVYGHCGGRSTRLGVAYAKTRERQEAIGIDWMTNTEMSQSIPPAYTFYIGKQLYSGL